MKKSKSKVNEVQQYFERTSTDAEDFRFYIDDGVENTRRMAKNGYT